MVVQCCQCKKVRVTASNYSRTRWVNSRNIDIDPRNVSHGYCPACAQRAFEEIRAYARAQRPVANHA